MKIGDKVTMNNKYYVSSEDKGRVWVVRSDPWYLCGTLVVLLDGMSGGYAVDGLTLVDQKLGGKEKRYGKIYKNTNL